jgi:hypothetical protein
MLDVLERAQEAKVAASADVLDLFAEAENAGRQGPEGGPAPGPLVAEVELAVAEALELAGTVRRLWAWVRGRAEAGKIRDQDATGGMLRRVFDRSLAGMEKAARSGRAAAQATGRPVTDLSRLEALLPELRRWTALVLQNWPWSARPWPPLDRAMAARSREELARGEGEDVATLLARLQAGGPAPGG